MIDFIDEDFFFDDFVNRLFQAHQQLAQRLRIGRIKHLFVGLHVQLAHFHRVFAFKSDPVPNPDFS